MFTGKNIHFIGIGGISMSSIAEILLNEGCKITGYDLTPSKITSSLEEKNIKVTYMPCKENIENADIIVYTAAIKEDFEELVYAKSLNKEIYERSTFLGLIMKSYKNVLCISGTHGKSTTTGMISTIFMETEFDPTISIGAMLPCINGNYHVGKKDYFIAEACEYVDSFLKFFPTSAVILNIDNDHLDYFKNLDNIIYSFKRFASLLPENGCLVINNDNQNTKFATKDIEKKTTYGIENSSNYMAKNITYNNFGHASYDLFINNENTIQINLSVSGIHNVYNSLAAIALCHNYISDLNIIKKALKKYTGVGRRFELIGKYKGANIYDDYAHHPSEIKTTLESVLKTEHNKTWAIFQPHTYSRTFEHQKEFAEVLSKFENIIITKIYGAREENTFGIKEEDILKQIINNGNKNAQYIEEFDDIIKFLEQNVSENDLVITIGAGPINKVGYALVEKGE